VEATINIWESLGQVAASNTQNLDISTMWSLVSWGIHGNEKEMDRVRWGADGRITSRGALGLVRSAASRPDPSRLSLPSVGFPLLACATRRNNRRLCFFCGGYNDGGDPMFLLSLLDCLWIWHSTLKMLICPFLVVCIKGTIHDLSASITFCSSPITNSSSLHTNVTYSKKNKCNCLTWYYWIC
jgi:hypothetical protein